MIEWILLAVSGLTLLLLLVLWKRPSGDTTALANQLQLLHELTERNERAWRDEMGRQREEQHKAARDLREETASALRQLGDSLHKQTEALRTALEQRFDTLRESSASTAQHSRQELQKSLSSFNESLQNQITLLTRQLRELTEQNQQRMEAVRLTIEKQLGDIRKDNGEQLERMRLTVDEKLQGTLEKRLGESFSLVSARLEQVYKGLGEMQVLASGVGDLKKVLTNVKTRGTWGEVQLGALLEQVLTQEQYEANVATCKGSSERVEYAVRLPGRDDSDNTPVWLPIDAKFPVEDYQRLLEAQDQADADAAESAAKQLEIRIRQCANDISRKYVSPPDTTDFAILFLPTEGLFAEVLRRPGLAEALQREQRVMIAGPTTLWSLLNSLQMGFRTLAIQKRSGEVWQLLSAVKTEWSKYGEALEKVQKKLQEASNSVEQAQTRTRAIGRKLKTVQELPGREAQDLLALESEVLGNDDGE